MAILEDVDDEVFRAAWILYGMQFDNRHRKILEEGEEAISEEVEEEEEVLHEEDEEEEAIREEKEEPESSQSIQTSRKQETNKTKLCSKKMKTDGQQGKKQTKKRQTIERDDTEETLKLLLQWKNNTSRNPPGYILDVADGYSEPIHKQLTSSDVKEDQCRLMLGKKEAEKMMKSQVLGESERPHGANGIEVMVYGPGDEVYKMMFKMWNGDTPVLTGKGWNEFVKRYGLKEFGYFLTIRMFRHRDTRKICLAIDFSRLPIQAMLSRRILMEVFKDQN